MGADKRTTRKSSLSGGPPALAAVYRGSAVESVHRGHIAVADVRGNLLWQTEGLTEEPVFFRSAMKPLQALRFVEGGAAAAFRAGDSEIAIACASHTGEPEHVAVVKRMLAKGKIALSCLKCGTHIPLSAEVAASLARSGKPPSVLCNNCSGKHAAQLLTCLHEGWTTRDYLEPDHPLQMEIKRIVGDFADLDLPELVSGKDGCNLPAHAVSLRRMAMTYARLASPQFWADRGSSARAAAIERITGAMRKEPFLVSGTGRGDNALMSAANGRVFSKIGAEAVWCLGFPREGLGLAMKIADGANRAEAVILAEALKQTGLLGPAGRKRFLDSQKKPITSSDGSVVGWCEPLFRLVPSRGAR